MPNSSQKPLQTPLQAYARGLLHELACASAVTLEQLGAHGVLELAAAAEPAALQPFVAPAQQARRELLAREMLHEALLTRLQHALGEAQVPAVLIKGEALARGVYPYPAVRPRHDIDLWIAPSQRAAVERVLSQLGGEPVPAAWGRWIQPEQLWRMQLGSAVLGIDLHWQFCSRPALLRALPWDQVLQRSSPCFSDAAHEHGLRLPSLADSLLLACIHRRAHHRDGERWIWLIDVALLWQLLDESARRMVADHAVAGGVAALLLDALRRLGARLGQAVSAGILDDLQRAAPHEAARYLLQAPQQYSDLRFDLRFAAGWQRLAVLRDYLLPRAAYMRWRYPQVRPRWLPWLYLRRLLRRLP